MPFNWALIKTIVFSLPFKESNFRTKWLFHILHKSSQSSPYTIVSAEYYFTSVSFCFLMSGVILRIQNLNIFYNRFPKKTLKSILFNLRFNIIQMFFAL